MRASAINSEAYLARLGLAAPPSSLAELQVAHLLAVPFENLDIVAGREISMEPDAIWDKVVTRRRGGFCYELNGLFARLLEALGYPVTLLSARVISDDDVENFEYAHLTLRVEDGESWLVDVGFGDTFREPIPLRPDTDFVDSLGRTYRFQVDGDEWTLLQERPQYRFTLTPRAFAEFEPMCRYQQTESPWFTGHRMCTIATASKPGDVIYTIDPVEGGHCASRTPVSYTHLTLPTILRV